MFIKLHLDKTLLYILILSIPFIIKDLFKKKLEITSNSIIEQFQSFSSCFLFIIYFIEKSKSKNQTKKIDFKFNLNFRKGIMFILLIISNLLSLYLSIIFVRYLEKFDYISDVFIYFLFMIFIQKKNYYSHHIFSIIILFIFAILFIIFFPTRNDSLNYYFEIISLLKGYCYSLNLLLIKYMNEIYFINIYLLGSINELFELIFEIIYYLIEKLTINFNDNIGMGMVIALIN